MLAANSYQMTLLTGQNYQDNLQLYVLSAVFLASSFVWYTMFRLKPSVYVLSAPWLFYGIAFFLIGVPSLSSKLQGTHTILSDIATWSYAVASAAAFIFFGLNFGEEAVSHFFRSSCQQLIFFSLGCCHRSLDTARLYCARLPTDLGGCPVVLG
jgi:glycogen synthase